MENLDGQFQVKWNCDRDHNFVGATSNITAEGPDGLHALVQSLRAQNPSLFIHIYTGVHGDPWGNFQIPEEDFSEADRNALHNPPYVVVIGLTQNEVMDQDLSKIEVSLRFPHSITVLGWCNSWYTIQYQLPHVTATL